MDTDKRDPLKDPRPGDVLRNTYWTRNIERVGSEFNPEYIGGTETFTSGHSRPFHVLTQADWRHWSRGAKVIHHAG